MKAVLPERREVGIVSSLRSYASNWASILCRFCVEEFLARGISCGCLEFIHEDGACVIYGEPERDAKESGRPSARVVLRNSSSFYARVAAAADIGFAEAFMAGDFVVDSPEDLTNIFRVLILNRDERKLSASALLLSRLGARANGLLHKLNRNTLSGSQRNIEAHYDLSNELFSTFLGPTWTYSCAHFGSPSGAAGRLTLDEAQHAKIDMLLSKAQVHAGCHVLDLGCGWGELSIRAAQRFGCRVTGITLSHEQLLLAQRRAEVAEVTELVRFELVDYRVMAERGEQFDRIISCEMVEAVGHEFLVEYFAAMQRLLSRDGVAVLQAITTPEGRYEEYRTTTDFIQKHIFPGGICPSLEAIVTAVARSTRLSVEHVENIGPHYATTLREWRKRFLQNAAEGAVAKAGFDDLFVRKWLYYFCYCEAGFATRTLGVLQIVLSESNNTGTLGEAPACAEGDAKQ